MIDNAKRLPFEFLGALLIQLAIAKYPFVLAGQPIPITLRELATMIFLSAIVAILLENMIVRFKELRKSNRRYDKNK